MSSKEIDGLKKIYLFKSADFQFADIDLSDNALFLGESGVGKTTLMRAILFFYTMDFSSSALNINTESKKNFRQWYFKEPNSHIVYEYFKDGKPFLFAVSSSGKLHYTFIEMSRDDIGVKELFLDGLEPVTLEKLHENIEKNLLQKYHTTQKDKYIKIFHKEDMDGDKIRWNRKEVSVDFSLFDSMITQREFAKTLSNIFATSKVSADSVKKTVVSLIDDKMTSINLKQIQNSLNEYIQNRDEIKQFEKKIPKINNLKKTLDEYREKKEEFKEYANEVELLKNRSDIKIVELDEEILALKKSKEDIKSEYKPKIGQLENSYDLKDKEIYSQSKEIERLKEKRDEYNSKDIQTLLLEYYQKESYQKSLEQAKQRYQALTANAEGIKDRYEKIFQQLKQDRDETIFALKKENMAKIENLSIKKIELLEKKSENITDKTLKLETKKEELKTLLNLEKDNLNAIDIRRVKVENYQYNQEAIRQYNQEIKKFNAETTKLNIKIPQIENSIRLKDREINDIDIRLKNEKDELSKKITKEKNHLHKEREEIEKKLNFDKNNLYGYINRNSIANRDNLLLFLKDELLFSEKEFTIEHIDNSNSIFGLDIQFKEIDFDYSITSLQARLLSIKENLKEQNNCLIKERNLLEDRARKETSKLDRERSRLLRDEQEQKELLQKYKDYRVRSKNSLNEVKKDALKRKKRELERVTKEYIKQQKEIEKIKQDINITSIAIQTIKNQIESDTQKAISKLNREIEDLRESEKKSIDNIREKYIKEIEQTTLELNRYLEEGGVDRDKLRELNSEITSYSSKLKKIEESLGYVSTYLNEYADRIKEIPKRESELKEESEFLKQLKIDLEKVKNEFIDKIDDIDKRIKREEDNKKEINAFIKKYNQEIKDDIKIKVNSVLTPEYSKDKISYSIALIENLIRAYNGLINSHDAILNKTQIATKGLNRDNIFKLEIIDDYMEESSNLNSYLSVANGLVEYIQKDKIKILKENLSSKFIKELRAIVKYVSQFEESLMEIEAKVDRLDKKVKKAVESFRVIDAIKIKKEKANNQILEKLKEVTKFYEKNSEHFNFGLFASQDKKESSRVQYELGDKIEELSKLLSSSKEYLFLEEGFVLTFTVTENGNRLHPAQTLNDIGSNGTSTLVKTIINISLLQMVNEKSRLLNHCILDEIGTISPKYFKELKDYANNSGFLFVNGMPIEDDILISMYPTVYIGQKYGNDSRMILASKMVV